MSTRTEFSKQKTMWTAWITATRDRECRNFTYLTLNGQPEVGSCCWTLAAQSFKASLRQGDAIVAVSSRTEQSGTLSRHATRTTAFCPVQFAARNNWHNRRRRRRGDAALGVGTIQYIGWRWRNFFISYLWSLFFRHVVGQALQNVSYSDITFFAR